MESFTILANVSKLFAERCIDGLVANEAHLREQAESSPSIVTPLNSAIGYEEAAKEALKERKTIRQTVIDRGLIGDKLSLEELDRRLDVLGDGEGCLERLREERLGEAGRLTGEPAGRMDRSANSTDPLGERHRGSC